MKITPVENNNQTFGQFYFSKSTKEAILKKLRTTKQINNFQKAVDAESANPRAIWIGRSIGFYAYLLNTPNLSADISKNIFETIPQFLRRVTKEFDKQNVIEKLAVFE